jgi:hypothetical protein
MYKNIKLIDLQYINSNLKDQFLKKVTIDKNRKREKKSRPATVNERNRARISFNKLESKIAAEGFSRHKEWHAYFYLSELLQRNAFDLFDKDIKKYIKRFTANENYTVLVLLKDLELERKIIQGSFTKESVQSINLILLQQLKFAEAASENLEWRYKSYAAFMRTIYPSISILNTSLKNPKGTWQKIYDLRAKMHDAKKIDEKISVLQSLYKITGKSTALTLKREHAAVCGNLATFNMIQGNFDNAHTYYNEAISLRNFFRPAGYFTLQYNFVGLSLRNLQFDLAYQSMLKVDSGIQQLPAIAFKWQLLKCMTYAFAGREKEIKNILPPVPSKKITSDYIYFYIIWAIYFTHTNKTETAQQMLETAQSLCKRHPTEQSMLVFITLLRKYHRFHEDHSHKISVEKTRELLKKVNMKELSSGNILPLVWLNKFLTHII